MACRFALSRQKIAADSAVRYVISGTVGTALLHNLMCELAVRIHHEPAKAATGSPLPAARQLSHIIAQPADEVTHALLHSHFAPGGTGIVNGDSLGSSDSGCLRQPLLLQHRPQ